MATMRDTYVVMVSALTGIAPRIVARADQRADFFGHFIALADEECAAQGECLLLLFERLTATRTPEEAVHLLLGKTIDRKLLAGFPRLDYSGLTRALSLFVLTGGWNSGCDPDNLQIPSSLIYTEGLVWRIAQTHAQGSSDMAPGSWGSPPEPLSSYIGT